MSGEELRPDPGELDELARALREDRLEDARVARLDRLLAEDPASLDRFVDLAFLQAALEAKWRGRPGLATPALRRPRRRGFRVAAAVAALLALAVLPRFLGTPGREEPLPSVRGLAVLSATAAAEWEEPLPGPGPGTLLDRSRLRLASGWIRLEYFSGVRVIVEGPADLDLASMEELICRRGRLRATVPVQAEGFTVRTPSIKVVDRGTEFGVWVDPSGPSEVHVFEGRVELVKGGGMVLGLGRDQALRFTGEGEGTPIVSAPRDFPTLSELSVRERAQERRRFEAWKSGVEELRRDPRLVLHYAFQEDRPWARELRSHRLETTPLDGTIVGCRWAEGRWPGKGALEFKLPGDRVRLRDGHSYESLTLAAWVRVDGLDRAFSGLLLTDRWDPGGIHWQITQDGKLRAGIRSREGGHDYDSPVVFDATRLGRWTFLALVYDVRSRTATHFVDGRISARHSLRTHLPLRIDDAELGNWGVAIGSGRHAIRNLNGRMDEFVLFRDALSDAEIAAFHEAGSPGD